MDPEDSTPTAFARILQEAFPGYVGLPERCAISLAIEVNQTDFSDVVQVITYLKSSKNLELFLQVWDEWGLGGLPNSIVEAGVCRPDLLCELEALAILPKS